MRHYTLFIFILLLIGMTSCKKGFLDDANQDANLTRQDYVKDLKSLEEYTRGIYVSIGSELLSSSSDVPYADVVADNLKPVISGTANGTTALFECYNWNQEANELQTSVNQNRNAQSYAYYRQIRKCNFVLEHVSMFENENRDLAANIRGQASGLRAYFHYVLVNLFAQQYNYSADGSHPGILYVKSSNITDSPGKRLTVRDVYSKIIEDLGLSRELLKDATFDKTYFGTAAVNALFARVYLSKGDFDQAKDFARLALADHPIMTTGYPEKLFTPEDTEGIWQFEPAEAATKNYSTFFYGVRFRGRMHYKATRDYADLLDEYADDKRHAWLVADANNGFNVTKFPVDAFPDIQGGISYSQSIFRSSEMALIAAESYAKIGNTDSARFFLDQIRLRANPVISPTNLSGQALLTQIYRERRKELAFEGFRLFDMLRWKQPIIRYDALPGSPRELSYPDDKAIAPIPVIDTKVAGIPQNESY